MMNCPEYMTAAKAKRYFAPFFFNPGIFVVFPFPYWGGTLLDTQRWWLILGISSGMLCLKGSQMARPFGCSCNSPMMRHRVHPAPKDGRDSAGQNLFPWECLGRCVMLFHVLPKDVPSKETILPCFLPDHALPLNMQAVSSYRLAPIKLSCSCSV